MRQSPRFSLRQFTLGTEIVWLCAVVVLIGSVLVIAYKQQQQHFYTIAKTDAQRVEAFFQERLDSVQAEFKEIVQSIENNEGPTTLRTTTFTDFYSLDDGLRISRIHKRAPESFVFSGFSFAGSRKLEFVHEGFSHGGFSSFQRGFEDDRVSLYYAARMYGQNYLARINLEQFARLLSGYKVAGNNALLVLNLDGVVVFASEPAVQPASFLLNAKQPASNWTDARTIAGQQWLPIISNSQPIKSTLVTLIPADVFQQQLDQLLWTGLLIIGLLAVLVVGRAFVEGRFIVNPLVSFSESLQKIKVSSTVTASLAPEAYRFREFHVIDQRMQEMLTAIQGRERDLAQAKERAERLEQLKSDFLASMSHELRTPLTIVLGVAELLARQPLNEEQRRLVASLESAGTGLLGVINDVLDISRIEAGQLTLRNEPVDLGALVKQVVELQRVLADKKGLLLSLQPLPDQPVIVLGDDLRVTQILQNLIGNAIKFTEKGGVTVALEARQLNPQQIEVDLIVTDTGIGISESDQKILFQPFVQARQGQRLQFGGTGLGLVITERLVKLMRGRICLTSRFGAGSVFTVCLPFTTTTAVNAIPDQPLKAAH